MTADTVGGVWTYSIELARALARHGIRVSLATMGSPASEWQCAEARSIPGLTLHESNYKLEWQDDPWDSVDEASLWLRELAAAVQPDLVHINGYSHASLAYGVPVLSVAHSCVCSWWRAVKQTAVPERYGEYRRRVCEGLAGADLVIAPSLAMLSCIEREYGFNGNAAVISNARDASRFRPAEKQPYILTGGRLWDAAKNTAALDGIAGQLEWPVLVAGEEADPEGRRQDFAGVQLLGRLSSEQMAERFAHAAIYALPARYEPFGLSVLEAALAGCALVLGDIPSLREVWGDAALYVDPENPEQLRQTLERVIRSTLLREDLAQRARLRARRYSPGRMAQAYLEAYRRAARLHQSRRRAAA